MAYKRANFKLDETNDIDDKMKVVRSPTFETKIIKAVFINQEIVVFPQKEMPGNLDEAVKFLFGEGVVVKQDCINNYDCIRITGATYVLDNVKTLNAVWEYKEVKDV